MKLRVAEWRISLDGDTPVVQRFSYDSRRGLEADLDDPTEATDICHALYDIPDDETVVTIPDWLADLEGIPTVNCRTVLQTKPLDESDKFVIVTRKPVVDQPDNLDDFVASPRKPVSIRLPKAYVRVYDWQSGNPHVECWNCGDVFVGANPIRFHAPRRFTHPDCDDIHEEHLCDDCAQHFVDPGEVDLSPCVACNEFTSTCTLRCLDGTDICDPIWLCSECATNYEATVTLLEDEALQDEAPA